MQNDVRNKNYAFQSSKRIFFISDPHFGHDNIIRYCNRPFANVQEMNKCLVENWNKTVGPDDIIFVLGDIAFGGAGVFEEIVPQLNGKKYLILGNHDYKNVRPRYRDWFVDVKTKMFISIDGQPIILNHEPLLCFGGQDSNRIWHLFGHVHTSKTNAQGCDYQRVKKMCTPTMYDVGADFNNFTPVSFETVRNRIERQIASSMNFIEQWESDKKHTENGELVFYTEKELQRALKKNGCETEQDLDELLFNSYGVHLINKIKKTA